MNNYNLDTPRGLQATINRLIGMDGTEAGEELALKCIQKAQFFKDIDLEFEARYAYIEQVRTLRKYHLALAMFPWLLKKCDEDRERFDYFHTLWTYKRIVSSATYFARIPLGKIEELFADFAQRYKDFGTGDKVIHYFKLRYLGEIGELAQAAKEYELYWQASTTDEMDDCQACQPNKLIDHLLRVGKYEEVLEMANPIIKGELSCHIVPGITYPKLVLPCLFLNRKEDAENFAVLARKKLKPSESSLTEFSYLITYYAIKGDFAKARHSVEKQFGFLGNAPELEKFNFYLSTSLWFDSLEATGKKTIKLNLPPNDILFLEAGIYSVEHTLAFFKQQLQSAATALDQRNGNSYYTDLIKQKLAEARELKQLFASSNAPN